jgi:hypothetical protein
MTDTFCLTLSQTAEAITGVPLSPRAIVLASEIGAADALPTCAALRVKIARMLRANSIRYTEGTLLQSALTDRAEHLFAQAPTHLIDEILADLTANRLYARLQAGLSCHVVIDGHNLVFRLSVLFRHLFDNGRPGSAAKGLLIERLRNQIDQARGLQITLWFDGALAAVETPHPQLTVRYSGGTGPDRADREIVAFLREQVPASPSPVFLVTDDIDEARRARKLGAQIVACGEFRRMVM